MQVAERINDITKLRAELRRNAKLRLEYLASLARLLREHNIEIGDESLANLVPADISELYAQDPPGGPRPAPRPEGPPGGPRPAPGGGPQRA